ncbi:MAG: hypothetical protein LKE36_02225 [Bacilli bacterium]|jgi:hypothetical protein|nr:hypothetical protein [Bacilli bacterium]OQA78636.1 MAG: hypothetical protein BWY30_00568 [Tenericutes bacterium ADurb.Bin239]
MEKTIKLNGKELRLASSLFTVISYRSVFGTELFEDVEKLDIAFKKNQKDVGRFIDILFRIVYALHKPFTSDSYNKFLQQFDFNVLSNVDELTTLANTIGELLGSIQNNSGNSSPQR